MLHLMILLFYFLKRKKKQKCSNALKKQFQLFKICKKNEIELFAIIIN